MNPELLHLYGPLSVHIYGVCIAIGVLLFGWLLTHDKKILSMTTPNMTLHLCLIGILVATISGRLLNILNSCETFSLHDLITPWTGGFSILGSIIGLAFAMPLCLLYYSLPILPMLDRAAVYAGLLQGFGRLGCFFTGCCYGIVSHSYWHVLYTHPNNSAPLYIPLHPVQLYSSIGLILLFLLLILLSKKATLADGQLTGLYLMGAAAERGITDIWRGERTEYFLIFSFYQMIAIIVFLAGSCIFWYTRPHYKLQQQPKMPL